jgi:hypothetical protein
MEGSYPTQAACLELINLLTWNCWRLANARKTVHLENLNTQMGLSVPRLVTPDILRPLEEYS